MAMILAPRRTNSMTMARPIPLVAPVTIVRKSEIDRRAIARPHPRWLSIAGAAWPALGLLDAADRTCRFRAADLNAAAGSGRGRQRDRRHSGGPVLRREPTDRPASGRWRRWFQHPGRQTIG